MMLLCAKVEVAFGNILMAQETCIQCIKENLLLIIDNMWIIITPIANTVSRTFETCVPKQLLGD